MGAVAGGELGGVEVEGGRGVEDGEEVELAFVAVPVAGHLHGQEMVGEDLEVGGVVDVVWDGLARIACLGIG